MRTSWHLVESQFFLNELGSLRVLDTPQLPFSPQRIFWVTRVLKGETRGFHAHRSGQQVLFCIQGSVSVKLFDGLAEQVLTISPTSTGIHILSGVWGEQTYLEEDSVLLVLSSGSFSEADYIRSKEEFELFLKQAE